MNFSHRIGPDPHRNNMTTPDTPGCPDIWEMEDGQFAIIGLDVTDELKFKLPETATCGDDEKIVLIPRRILVDAKNDIPKQ